MTHRQPLARCHRCRHESQTDRCGLCADCAIDEAAAEARALRELDALIAENLRAGLDALMADPTAFLVDR